MQKFDPLTRGLTLKDCTYRFYRDTRFSPDKSPYKRHFGLFICPNGKKSGLAGYYFHVEGENAEYLGHNGLYPGMYMCEPFISETFSGAVVLIHYIVHNGVPPLAGVSAQAV